MTIESAQAGPADLVRRCVTGDDAARAEFITRYDPLIRKAIARRIQRTAAARANAAYVDDIAHEVYLRLFADQCRALGTVRDAERINAWLVTVAQNQAVGFLRKAGVSAAAPDNEAAEVPTPYEHGPENRAIVNEAAQRLAACLSRIDTKDRLVLQLYYVYNLRYVDIANTLNMNINTVASRLLRAKQRLREMLEDEPQ